MTPTWDELSRWRWAPGNHPGIVIEPGRPFPTAEQLRAIFAEAKRLEEPLATPGKASQTPPVTSTRPAP